VEDASESVIELAVSPSERHHDVCIVPTLGIELVTISQAERHHQPTHSAAILIGSSHYAKLHGLFLDHLLRNQFPSATTWQSDVERVVDAA